MPDKLLKLISAVFLLCCLQSVSAIAATTSPSDVTSKNKVAAPIEEEDVDFNFSDSSNLAEIYDPFEKMNRKIFVFNDYFDRYFLEHVARGYRAALPKRARISIGNFLHNLSMPLVIVNSALQGDLDNSLGSFSSFLINSTVGVFGLFDVAGKKRIKYRKEDFGQTFAKYQMGQGPYLVLPFFGPNNLRDASGLLIEKLIDPLAFNALEVGGSRDLVRTDVSVGIAAASAVDVREGLLEVIDDIRRDSFDPYATVRSAYLQKRNALILNK